MNVPMYHFRARRLELFARVTKHATLKGPGCWEWRGPVKRRSQRSGHTRARPEYGCIQIRRRNGKTVDLAAHRVSYWLRYGDPGPLLLRHMCDNPKCIKPQHLAPGTHEENMRDRDGW